MKGRPFRERLRFALSGLREAWRSELSLRTEVVIAVLGLGVMIVLRPALIWWALGGAMVALVLAAELANSALEHLADHLHPERHPKVAIVKDMAAAAVLVLAAGAVWVGVLAVMSVCG
jgi:diacylglycerol kinase (ATP)